jgi:uncharacterized LabA/DUF88 family protein
MRTIVYVDGFNFYYGSCKGTPHRWVNPWRVAEHLLPAPDHELVALFYFTAAIKPQPHDPAQRQRQECYWRALRTVPNLSLVEGTYLQSRRQLPRVEPRWLRALRRRLARWPRLRPLAAPRTVAVLRAEEKGSDINLATQLLLDAFDHRFDCAAVLSNDSDLLAPIRAVRLRFGRRIGLLAGPSHPSRVLTAEVNFVKHIREGVMALSQFPPSLTDERGTFHKPAAW